MSERPLADAMVATSALAVTMLRSIAEAERLEDAPRHEHLALIDAAIAAAKELVTRLEVARDLFLSTPQPVNSSSWTEHAAPSRADLEGTVCPDCGIRGGHAFECPASMLERGHTGESDD